MVPYSGTFYSQSTSRLALSSTETSQKLYLRIQNAERKSFSSVWPDLCKTKTIQRIPSVRHRLEFLILLSRRREGEAPSYTWTRSDNRPLPAGYSLQDYDRKLIIPSVQPEDQGVYVCEAEYQSSRSSKSITLSISGLLSMSPPISRSGVCVLMLQWFCYSQAVLR